MSLILAAAAMQAFPVTGEPLSTASFAVSTVAPGAATGSAGGLARVKHDPAPTGDRRTSQSADDAVGGFKFFGFLEFDWDSPGSGGVPGFGPLADSPSQVALADTSK